MADEGASTCVLPPSPNWYCSSATDCSVTGAYAFVAKRRVYILDVSRDPPGFKGQFTEHADRTSAVVCCPHQGFSNLCVSGSDDKTVKIWDIETKLVAASHNAHQVSI
jgi:gem associated protein 5